MFTIEELLTIGRTMNNKVFIKNILTCLLLLLLVAPIFAAGKGKIVGKIIDKESNESLPGVNILVLNTPFGAAADVEGYYMLLDLPVGIYDLKAQMIGYAPVVIKGVLVKSDLTTTQDISMEVEILTTTGAVVSLVEPTE